MSTTSQHVKPVFPYISDTGTWPPESCIFSLMLFIFSIIMGVLYCVRFKQVQIFCENLPEKTKTSILKLNKTSLWFGFASCFGLVLVASFQETNLMWVHMLGAGNVYGGGCIYQWLQTFLSWNLNPQGQKTKTINIVRVILTSISTITYIICNIFGTLSLLKFSGDNITLWDANDGGYKFHLTSTITEWILTAASMSFFYTFTKDLKEIVVCEILMIQMA
ncbi:DNA damage-regulated autophagy modulator protein 2-like [Sitophilus oryzae]|uniref:DNA damage-regulated autophagy modulator protein 2-like n=1 Tax=Sitophilus oryzae TaxID=7048 RepID=A0A6J2YCK9_SITOR|nr:DNA damage-regulated autophagy modulator protein 2-like [Sitophilus oryzae]